MRYLVANASDRQKAAKVFIAGAIGETSGDACSPQFQQGGGGGAQVLTRGLWSARSCNHELYDMREEGTDSAVMLPMSSVF